jgi:hypothetical protein
MDPMVEGGSAPPSEVRIGATEGQTLRVAHSLRDLIAATADELRRAHDDAFVVSADHQLASLFGRHGRTPSDIREALKNAPNSSLVVIGGTRLMPNMRGLVRADQTVHVVVASDLDTAAQRDRFVDRVLLPTRLERCPSRGNVLREVERHGALDVTLASDR